MTKTLGVEVVAASAAARQSRGTLAPFALPRLQLRMGDAIVADECKFSS